MCVGGCACVCVSVWLHVHWYALAFRWATFHRAYRAWIHTSTPLHSGFRQTHWQTAPLSVLLQSHPLACLCVFACLFMHVCLICNECGWVWCKGPRTSICLFRGSRWISGCIDILSFAAVSMAHTLYFRRWITHECKQFLHNSLTNKESAVKVSKSRKEAEKWQVRWEINEGPGCRGMILGWVQRVKLRQEAS